MIRFYLTIVLLLTGSLLGAQDVVTDSLNTNDSEDSQLSNSTHKPWKVFLSAGFAVGDKKVENAMGYWQDGRVIQIEFQREVYRNWNIGINYGESLRRYYVEDIRLESLYPDLDISELYEKYTVYNNDNYLKMNYHGFTAYISKTIEINSLSIEPRIYVGGAEYFTQANFKSVYELKEDNYAIEYWLFGKKQRQRSTVVYPSLSLNYDFVENKDYQLGIQGKVDAIYHESSELFVLKSKDIHGNTNAKEFKLQQSGIDYNVLFGLYMKF